ncbi:MAG: M48 family metalloprotease, partial [Psychroflexus sp.]|nr:M48 family metalloprotease [Psychroflexus sp.]
SKRSSKANAYFSGFGSQKQVTLYDTLIEKLTADEVVAVLAHEVGHYKKKHIIFNLLMALLSTGLTFFVLSLFINLPVVSQAFGVENPNFHIGLVAFSFIYAPVNTVLGIVTNIVSRKFEYQADDFAKATHSATDLMHGLKKLSRDSLSNLTPHSLNVFLNYSHPSLHQRFRNLKENA